MNSQEKFFAALRERNYRITKSRKAIIDILANEHLTFKQIYEALKRRGFHNKATLYNNLAFLMDHKIITELYINDERYYDLTIDNLNHSADSHIHLILTENQEIIEINNNQVFQSVKEMSELSKYDVDAIRITIIASKKKKSLHMKD